MSSKKRIIIKEEKKWDIGTILAKKGIPFEKNKMFRVSISEKVGTRRKLKSYWACCVDTCDCCGPFWAFSRR